MLPIFSWFCNSKKIDKIMSYTQDILLKERLSLSEEINRLQSSYIVYVGEYLHNIGSDTRYKKENQKHFILSEENSTKLSNLFSSMRLFHFNDFIIKSHIDCLLNQLDIDLSLKNEINDYCFNIADEYFKNIKDTIEIKKNEISPKIDSILIYLNLNSTFQNLYEAKLTIELLKIYYKLILFGLFKYQNIINDNDNIFPLDKNIKNIEDLNTFDKCYLKHLDKQNNISSIRNLFEKES